MRLDDVPDLSTPRLIKLLSIFTDLAFEYKSIDGLEKSIIFLNSILKKDLNDSERSDICYLLSNAYCWTNRFKNSSLNDVWRWDNSEYENVIFFLRKATHRHLARRYDAIRLMQINTNLGNSMSCVGRFVEALEYWDTALEIDPNFPMANGNKGECYFVYGNHLYDDGHRAYFYKEAYKYLQSSLKFRLFDEDRLHFIGIVDKIKKSINVNGIPDLKLKHFSLGNDGEEQLYRKWCLKNKLFLNPLNDLCVYDICARDIFHCASVAAPIDQGPYHFGLYNQLKQEFVSARFLLYEGMTSYDKHYSDREVMLYNTLDYPLYSLGLEKIKCAYRMSYSIFDKIAYFIYKYYNIDVDERKVSLRTIWYDIKKKKREFRKQFKNMRNLPWRGLYWLSKDLYENNKMFQEVIEPDAREINEVRNQIEHKYLKIHEMLINMSEREEHKDIFKDRWAYSIKNEDIISKTKKILKLARAALIYLSLGVRIEEMKRDDRRNKVVGSGALPLME